MSKKSLYLKVLAVLCSLTVVMLLVYYQESAAFPQQKKGIDLSINYQLLSSIENVTYYISDLSRYLSRSILYFS